MAARTRAGKALEAVAVAHAFPSTSTSNESGSEVEDVASGDSSIEDEHDSDSDSLDSTAPRKRRRFSQPPEEEGDEEDEEDEQGSPKGPVSFISAPSRIKRKTASDVKPTGPESTGEVTAQQPDDVLGGATTAPTDPNITFESLGVHPWLVQSLTNMAIRRPTGIQKGCIPEILNGSDCIGGSRTGSGKTVAFAVPILQKWAEDPSAIFAVVLTPTR